MGAEVEDNWRRARIVVVIFDIYMWITSLVFPQEVDNVPQRCP
jgi:hypothetical protein